MDDCIYALGLSDNRCNEWFENRAKMAITYQVSYLELREDMFPGSDEWFWLY